MKTLSNLKMSEFIDIYCGKESLILEQGEHVSEPEMKAYIARLMYDYKMIVNPVAMKSIISEQKQLLLQTARIYILKICSTLIQLNNVDKAREVLSEIGWHAGNFDEKTLSGKVTSELRRLEFSVKRITEEQTEEEKKNIQYSEREIRETFDKEQASLMTYFKMNISMESITAAVYANMLAQAEREITARNKILSKIK